MKNDSCSRGYQFLPLVPEVVVDFSVPGHDANGYKAATPDWYFADSNALDPAWRRAVDVNYGERENARGISYLYFTLNRADPELAPLPVCVLTDASELGAP